MPISNLLTCGGFAGEQKGSVLDLVAGECIKARLGLVFMFFLIAIIRKWGGEEIGLDFSFLFSLIGGLGGYFIMITIFGSLKWAFGIAILLALVFGYGAGVVIGGEE